MRCNSQGRKSLLGLSKLTLVTLTVLVAAGSWIPNTALAFPENIRHGYINCSTCHYAPTGGGLLTDYGRSLSKELLSTWNFEGEERALYGALPAESPVKLGGSIRVIQTHLENDRVRRGSFFLMQQMLEVGLELKRFVLVAALGTKEGPRPSTPNQGTFLSERHYVLFRASDQTSVRAGKFRFQYGINDPTHTRFVKRDLGFDQGFEPYNLEISHTEEQWGFFATAVLGRIDDPSLDNEHGYSLGLDLFTGEKSRIGLNTYLGENSTTRRNLHGAYTMLGLTKSLTLLTEVNYQMVTKSGGRPAATPGWVSNLKLSWELYWGVWPYFISEFSHLDTNNTTTRKNGHGLGLDFFPRPHIQVSAEFQKQMVASRGETYGDWAWVLFHYYL